MEATKNDTSHHMGKVLPMVKTGGPTWNIDQPPCMHIGLPFLRVPFFGGLKGTSTGKPTILGGWFVFLSAFSRIFCFFTKPLEM